MSNKIFLDSSILIEYAKATRPELYEDLLQNDKLDLYFGSPVVSEYLFHFLAILGGKSPLALKMSGQISLLFTKNNPLDIFQPLNFLPDAPSILTSSAKFMTDYNLLPNDAMILALCKLHKIGFLASFDSDFEVACEKEKIVLIQSVDGLKKWF